MFFFVLIIPVIKTHELRTSNKKKYKYLFTFFCRNTSKIPHKTDLPYQLLLLFIYYHMNPYHNLSAYIPGFFQACRVK